MRTPSKHWQMEGATIPSPGSGYDWIAGDEWGDGRTSYIALCEKECCDDPDHDQVEDAFVILSPLTGFGIGSVVNAIDKAGLRLVHISPVPTYLTEEQLADREAAFLLDNLGISQEECG